MRRYEIIRFFCDKCTPLLSLSGRGKRLGLLALFGRGMTGACGRGDGVGRRARQVGEPVRCKWCGRAWQARGQCDAGCAAGGVLGGAAEERGEEGRDPGGPEPARDPRRARGWRIKTSATQGPGKCGASDGGEGWSLPGASALPPSRPGGHPAGGRHGAGTERT